MTSGLKLLDIGAHLVAGGLDAVDPLLLGHGAGNQGVHGVEEDLADGAQTGHGLVGGEGTQSGLGTVIIDAVEDLVQEVFISVWEGKRTFSDSRELTNYLYRACYNNALLYIRNHQIHDSILNGLPQEEDFEDEEMLYALTVKEEAIRQLYFYIEELPAEQRRIILLRIEGHSWDEIASRLGVSINTVKTQKSRSYKFLREKLANSSYSVLLTLIFY